MKHIFIINPVAGTGEARKLFMPRILEELKNYDLDYKVHITTKKDDARRFVKRLCSFRKDSSQTLRFYACGGDGTLSEVINGAIYFSNVQIACIPAGTGNDFIRNFGDAKKFRDIKAQFFGRAHPVDVMAYRSDDGQIRFGINLINMGVDCEAAQYMETAKKTKLLRGTSAYIFGAACAFARLITHRIQVLLDEKKTHDGEITLLAVGNGTTYGGGFKATPEARTDDGLLDICLVKKINRRQFLQLVGSYKKGTHLISKQAREVIRYRKAQKIEIRSEQEIGIAVDGEIIHTKKLQVEVQPRAIRFVVPDPQ